MRHASVGVARGILRNASALFLVGLFAKGAGLIIAILVARFLGADAMGLFAVLFSVAVLIETFLSLGMSDSLVRDVAARPSGAAGLFVAALKLVGVLSIVPAAGLLAAALLIDDHESARASLIVLAIGTPISGSFVVGQAVLQGSERVHFLTWVTFLARVVSLALLFLAFFQGAGLAAAFGSRVLFHLLALAAFSLALLRGRAASEPDHSVRSLLTRAVPFAVNKALREIGLRMPSLVLPGAIGLGAAGIFDAANRIRSTVSMTMSASIVGLMPALSRDAARDGGESGTLVGYSIKYMCLGMSAVATVIAVLSDWIVRLLYGSEFAAAALPLQLLAWTQVLNGIDAVLQQTMLARGNVKPAIRHSAVGIALQLVLLVALSRAIGLTGAAIAVLLSSAAAMTFDLRYVVRHVTPIPLGHFALAPVATGLFVACAIFAAGELPVVQRLLVAVGSWLVAVALFRVLPRNELQFIRQLAKRKRR